MNIKYYYGKAICLLLLLSAAMACTDSRVIDPDEGSDVEVPIMLNLKGLFSEEDVPPTYTLTPGGDAPGAGAENTVTDVRIFIFNAITNACERIIAVSSLVNPIGPELVKSGNKNIVVVVNGNGKFNKNPFYTAGEENQINYNGLRYMLTEPVANLPAAPFLMTAEKNVMLQPYQPSNAPNQIDLEVKRSVAKVKIFVKKSGDALSHHLWLKTVTLHQGADRVSTLYNLLGDPNVITYNLDSVSTNFDPATRVIPNSGYCQVLDTFYTYETLASRDKSKAVYFDFEVEVNAAANIRKCRVYLAEDALSATDTVYNVYRNHWYNVYVDIVKPGLDSVYVKVIASPWNVADTIRIIEGAGFETQQASPFKLVKYYDTDDLTKDPTIAAIDKHSKGASWINVKVTENTNWELNFTSSGGGNANSILSADTGKHWSSSLSGTGTNEWQRIYIYRPYVENNEPKEGPSVTLKVGGQNVRTFTVHPRDSLIFPTNSYLLRPYNFSGLGRSETFIPLNHVYDFWEDFLLVNGDTIPGGSTPTVDLSWQDNPGTTIQGSPAIINATDRRNSYIRAEAGPAQGNVILDFKVNGTVYWSFHIWNTEYSPYELAGQLLYKTSASTPVKNFFMDRNLGAMDTLYTPSGSAQGLNYQFGRKDPFPWWILDNNNVEYVWYEFPGPVRKTTITTATAPAAANASVVRPLLAIPTVLKNPKTFYTNDVSAFTKESGGYSWNTKGGNKTAFDPCPEGYRVPVQSGLGNTYSPWYGATLTDPGGIYNGGRYFIELNYFPMLVILPNGLGVDYGYYWTSYDEGAAATNAIGMNIDGGLNLNESLSKSSGAKIRCVVDKNYILNKKGTVFGRYTEKIIENLK